MRNIKSFVSIVVFAVASGAFATDWYVSESGNDGNDGKSWDTAFRRLSKPLGRNINGNGFAASGDTVWVEDGYECSTEKGDVSMGAIPSSGSGTATVIVQQGVTLRSRSGDWRTGAVIRGVNAEHCLSLTAGATAFGFRIIGSGSTKSSMSGANRTQCVVSNMLVAGGRAVRGLQVHNCIITNAFDSFAINSDIYDSVIGNATVPLVAKSCDATFNHCTITNFAGVALVAGAANMVDCEVMHIQGTVGAAGLVMNRCLVAYNEYTKSNNGGAGILSAGIYSNCTITANHTENTAGSGYGFTGGCLFGNGVRVVGCTITNNIANGAYDKSGNIYGALGYRTIFENCYVADNLVNPGFYLQGGEAVNSVFVSTNTLTRPICADTKFCNTTIYSVNACCPGASTNSVFWKCDTGACGDPTITLKGWTDRTPPVNCCSARAASDTTGTSFSTDPGLDFNPASKTFLMPLKGSPCIDKCTGNYAFAWMTDDADIRSKDVYRHKRVLGEAADIGAIEYKPTMGMKIIFR